MPPSDAPGVSQPEAADPEGHAGAHVVGAEEDFFDAANLSPVLTGLPMIVWISEGGGARHDVRVKVAGAHERRARPDNTVSVSVRPNIDVVAGAALDRSDMVSVRKWIELNAATIVAYRDGDLFTDGAIARLRLVTP